MSMWKKTHNIHPAMSAQTRCEIQKLILCDPAGVLRDTTFGCLGFSREITHLWQRVQHLRPCDIKFMTFESLLEQLTDPAEKMSH